MSDQHVELNDDYVNTTANKTAIIQNALSILNHDQENSVSTGYVAMQLLKLDPALATSSAQLTQKAIEDSSGLNLQQKHQLRVNILMKAFEKLNKDVQIEPGR